VERRSNGACIRSLATHARPRSTPTRSSRSRLAFANGEAPLRALDQLWDGLEAFPTEGDEIEPAPLAAAVADALGIAPDAAGLVDHDRVGDAWEMSQGSVSIIDALLQQLSAG
jgi:hypothetical protein